MGYMRHHAIVMTAGYDEGHALVNAAAELAESLGLAVSAPAASSTNRYVSRCIFPDGSKEGWETSAEGDEARARVIDLMRSAAYSDGSSPVAWVEVQYGDDEGETKVVGSSDDDLPPLQYRHGGGRVSEIVTIADRCVVFVCTIAPFRRPDNPRRCNVKRYHVWRWRGGPKAPPGTLCQCGLLDDPPECRDPAEVRPSVAEGSGDGG